MRSGVSARTRGVVARRHNDCVHQVSPAPNSIAGTIQVSAAAPTPRPNAARASVATPSMAVRARVSPALRMSASTTASSAQKSGPSAGTEPQRK